uniref:KIB1-4 beta-propeller domain-containing protein n=1 Tax=Leersia perrieri TaxID=77586 RepID=A0A0D9XHL6_9ORYZ
MSTSTSRQQAAASSPPLLVLYDDGTNADHQRRTTLYSVADDVHRPYDIDDELLRTKRSWVTTSHGGWVLTFDPETLATFLWNPHATTNVITLPSFGQSPPTLKASCTLSNKPTSRRFTVVMVDTNSNVMWYCHVSSPAAVSSSLSSWTKQEYDDDDDELRSICCLAPSPCGGDGKFYYLISRGLYGVLDFSAPDQPVFGTVRLKPISLFAMNDILVYSPFLLDINGKLCRVFIFHGDTCNIVIDVAIDRVDIEKQRHTAIRSIGDRAILVGGTHDFAGWCRASCHGLLPNSIYWMNPRDSTLRVYRIGHNTEEIRTRLIVSPTPSSNLCPAQQ